jgi:hypothetical protein
MRNQQTLGAVALVAGTFLSGVAQAQSPCPAVGADTGCGSIITVTQTGAIITNTNQGPYDGSDDTIVGVINNSNLPIYSLDLTSATNIFAFDGDGIDSPPYNIPGNPLDTTGYGGPNAYFSTISADMTSGRVNFIIPIAANGGTSFFSLENVLATSTGCTDLLNNSVPQPAGGASITTTFTPQGNDPNTGVPYTIAAAAQVCGFIGFDWQQTITALPTPLPGNGFNAIATPTTPPAAPFNDPPPSGYEYMLPVPPGPLDAPQLAVYWDPFNGADSGGFGLAANTTATQLTFFDSPADPCLPGMQNAATIAYANQVCGGVNVRAPAGSAIDFTTHLVGLQGQLPGAAVVDLGIGFDWTSNFNGTSGGIAVLPSLKQPDPGSGVGGITVTNYTATTNYVGVIVSAVNGSNARGPSPLLASVLPASRSVEVGATATAFATVINTAATTTPGCSLALTNGLPADFHYQATNPATNQVTGSPDTPIDIAAGKAQSFVFSLTPSDVVSPTNAPLTFSCTNIAPAPTFVGLNTLLFSASATPTPDLVALGATASGDGVLHVPGAAGSGAFATATVNLGSGDMITASANTGTASLPLALAICQTDPTTGQCLAAPTASVTTMINPNATPTFSVFATASGAIAFDPANSRIFVQFADSTNTVRGETSVAVETQ